MFKAFLSRALTSSVLGALLLATATPAFAHEFTVTNDGSHTIQSVYISPPGSGLWGPDQLGSDVIGPGYDMTWTWAYQCVQDVRIVYTNSAASNFMHFDTCTDDLTVYY